MTLDLAALRRQAESCGDPMALHPLVVLDMIGTIARLEKANHDMTIRYWQTPAGRRVIELGAEADDLRAKLEEAEIALRDWVVCYHCNESMPATGADDHGRTCPKHPQRKVESERDALASQVAVVRDLVAEFSRRLTTSGHGGWPGCTCDDCRYTTSAGTFLADMAQAATEYREQVVREEREACAATCDAYLNEETLEHYPPRRAWPNGIEVRAVEAVARIIRARGGSR